MKENRVAIIGGDGAMGKMTDNLFRSIGYETVVSDIKKVHSPSPFEAIQGASTVFFSVLPIEEIPKIIDAVSDILTPQNIMLDNAGVKGPIEQTLVELDRRGLSVCSTHPLCRPDLELKKEKVLIMGVGNNSHRAKVLAERLYSSAEMEIVPFKFEEHDERMAISQLVPHLVMRTVAEVLSNSGLNISDLFSTATANFQLFLLSLARVEIQNPAISLQQINDLLKTDFGGHFGRELPKTMREIVNGERSSDSFQAVSENLLGDSTKHVTELTGGAIKYLKNPEA